MLTNCSLLKTDSPRGKEIENSNHVAINKPVKGLEMYILKQLKAIQKSVDSIMNCKYKKHNVGKHVKRHKKNRYKTYFHGNSNFNGQTKWTEGDHPTSLQ